ncbi:protein serine/threonine phosphatase 2C [Suhomyces tanzawaensis NRRL Y-17324]|uniref:Protein phosphatase n=1 Tax=Suhomyces tanzawaensis NRRL Y-17324 TaxID=984487 RepID=A0A1E4SH46_9ASCO|nr:protein serine/threonine phosphatase 2C [Suhomyces tanzawaensis NRRL Y-17324]ODV78833.1 protein serine/threonine phosphatase 2C [Suhomyces tanzawaensis NRRL Y-17324]
MRLQTLAPPTKSAARSIQACRSIFQGARHYFLGGLMDRDPPKDEGLAYMSYPCVTREQMRKISNDKYKFEFGYHSYAHHSNNSDPLIHSLSDLTDPTLLNSLLPKRRPQGSPVDTISVKAGDDAMLVSPTVLAIADGVSGWESKGEHCSSGIWSRSMVETLSRLMTEYKLSHAPHHLNKRDIDQILDDSYLHTSHLMDLQDLRGSSTLILGMLSGEYLKMISIGDSKIYIIRDGKIVKSNEEQMVSDLCPQQIGTQTLDQMPSEMAWVDSIKLKEDDLIVACSDGISDNLYEEEIVQCIDDSVKSNKDLKTIARKLLLKAKAVGFDDYAYTPYNQQVNALPEKYGKNLSSGGKLDDMSVCVARVVPNRKG